MPLTLPLPSPSLVLLLQQEEEEEGGRQGHTLSKLNDLPTHPSIHLFASYSIPSVSCLVWFVFPPQLLLFFSCRGI